MSRFGFKGYTIGRSVHGQFGFWRESLLLHYSYQYARDKQYKKWTLESSTSEDRKHFPRSSTIAWNERHRTNCYYCKIHQFIPRKKAFDYVKILVLPHFQGSFSAECSAKIVNHLQPVRGPWARISFEHCLLTNVSRVNDQRFTSLILPRTVDPNSTCALFAYECIHE